ncbi:D-alanyl-D-alanine carboxypeptidase/D-alanyl-D-alanine-endopeptidase [Cytobacillus luteolus]|uniref:D-alanyl-D-alanine carboxypeptidase/D-alanyl-D-alanine endopeptidase n=1 Tax=Litchfieldia luteola TaxID=682179 RepID=UPI001CB525A5|nr:D-alanyl-D-alanine carboxypeptidase/D-alanyl-D-alanine-endopeptidase [Cytobacillus luteolus]MBP1944520.1 D-alanyl-D-alanine carboxypeptidase/D-alanyl-D-alanine-endopeptidase (penicillin-binding protein 4) [Cytobacillus luteolus]
MGFIYSVPIQTVQAAEIGSLTSELNLFLENEPDLKGTIVGVSIRSATTGELIYQHNGNTRLRPASNMKLLTAAAALSALGENYTFKTEILTDGKVRNDTLKGNLFLKGKGDPTLLTEDFDQMASELSKKGIRYIRGDLIADDSWYDDVRYSVDLPWSDETAYYGGQVSALTAAPDKDYDTGAVRISVRPGDKAGKKAIIKVTPKTNYVVIKNRVITVENEEKKQLEITRKHGSNEILIQGRIPIDSKPYKEWVAVWEPTGLALDLFKQALNKEEIKVVGKSRFDKTPNEATPITDHHSMPLKDLFIPFMKLSNNVHAETLVKEMGRVIKGSGTWESGLDVMNSEMSKLGLNTASCVIRDGSGISHINLISTNEVSKLLFNSQSQPWFPVYLQSLPVAGNMDRMTGGTLRHRLSTVGNVYAKTGTLTTVSSISGYIDTKSGNKLIFSIILNNLLEDTKGKAIEDKMIELISNY